MTEVRCWANLPKGKVHGWGIIGRMCKNNKWLITTEYPGKSPGFKHYSHIAFMMLRAAIKAGVFKAALLGQYRSPTG